jgi:hypothetical protein
VLSVIDLGANKPSAMQVGFGEAGAEIISKNLMNSSDTNAPLIDPLIPGKRVYAIFGFCDIHQFDHATERLEKDVRTSTSAVRVVKFLRRSCSS